MANKYVTLRALIEEWSKQSGELPQVVLTNLCDYDRRRRFPADTFIFRSSGCGCYPGELDELLQRMRLSGYNWIRDDAAKTLKDVVADKVAILCYCKEHSVRPPRSILGYWRWLFWKKSQFTAPPRYAFGSFLHLPRQCGTQALPRGPPYLGSFRAPAKNVYGATALFVRFQWVKILLPVLVPVLVW